MAPQRRCAPLRDSRLDRLPPASNSWSASCCHVGDMIAPTAHGCKRAVAGAFELVRNGGSQPLIKREIYRHGIVSRIIILPNFRLSTALLDCDKGLLRWPGPFGTGFLSPQPPGVVRIGPVRKKHTPILDQRELVLFLFELSCWGSRFRCALRSAHRACEPKRNGEIRQCSDV